VTPLAAAEHGFQPIGFPWNGEGSGGFNRERVREIMDDELAKMKNVMEDPDTSQVQPVGIPAGLDGDVGGGESNLSRRQVAHRPPGLVGGL